jgi:acyl-CoA hydrolase
VSGANGFVSARGHGLSAAQASDHIEFRKPVPIGCVVLFSSMVSYVQDDSVQVMVEADVADPQTGTRDTTNVFSFTYHVPGRVLCAGIGRLCV